MNKDRWQNDKRKLYTASYIKMKDDLTLIIFPVERLLAMKIGTKKRLKTLLQPLGWQVSYI